MKTRSIQMKMIINLEVAMKNTKADAEIVQSLDLDHVLVQWVHNQPEQLVLADPSKALSHPMVLISTDRDYVDAGEAPHYSIQYFHPYANASLHMQLTTDLKVVSFSSEDQEWYNCFTHVDGGLADTVTLKEALENIEKHFPSKVSLAGPVVKNILQRHTFSAESMSFN